MEPKPIYKASTTIISQPTARQRRKKRVLPQVLQGLMGEANVKFAKGEVEIAEQMCMEIIRQVFKRVYRIDIYFSSFLYLEQGCQNSIFFFLLKSMVIKTDIFWKKPAKTFLKMIKYI